jgi:hypothetical protein
MSKLQITNMHGDRLQHCLLRNSNLTSRVVSICGDVVRTVINS